MNQENSILTKNWTNQSLGRKIKDLGPKSAFSLTLACETLFFTIHYSKSGSRPSRAWLVRRALDFGREENQESIVEQFRIEFRTENERRRETTSFTQSLLAVDQRGLNSVRNCTILLIRFVKSLINYRSTVVPPWDFWVFVLGRVSLVRSK